MVVVFYSDYNGSFSYKLLALTSVFRLSSVHSIVTKKTNEILKYLEAQQYVYIVTPCFFTRNKENKTMSQAYHFSSQIRNVVKLTCFLQMAVRCNLKG